MQTPRIPGAHGSGTPVVQRVRAVTSADPSADLQADARLASPRMSHPIGPAPDAAAAARSVDHSTNAPRTRHERATIVIAAS